MLQSHINLLIDSLGCWYEDGTMKEDPKKFVEEAFQTGILPDSKLCLYSVMEYIKSHDINYNSTFYKTWQDVLSKNRLELFIDQILHYMSTYGTNYEGDTYVPNVEPVKVEYEKFRKILCVTEDEMIEKIMNLLKGVALNSELSEACAAFLCVMSIRGHEIDFQSIENNETRCILYKNTGIVPNSTSEIRRCINFSLTGSPVIIQNSETLYRIRFSNESSDYLVKVIDKLDCVPELMLKMSQEFLRYRKWWLSIKKYAESEPKERLIRKFVNKLRENARKVHMPVRKSFWDNITCFSREYIMENMKDELKNLNNPFRVIKLLEMIRLRKTQAQTQSNRLFKIRNGKTYMSDKSTYYDPILDDVSKILLEHLISLIAKDREEKYKKGELKSLHPSIKFPTGLFLAIPSSAKTFVGNIPFGSYYLMDDHYSFIGIYWRNEWGTHDFDLSLIDIDGKRIAWNSSFKNNDVVFSGDMTNADPEAVELMSIKNDCPECVVHVNRYNGHQGSKYKVFLGQEQINQIYKNYMVNPNNIKLEFDVISDATQQTIGYIRDNKCYIMNFGTGMSITSCVDKDIIETWRDQCVSHLPLKEILLAAGYRNWEPYFEKVDIDLTNPTKDVLLGLV